jgi:hypothetical protein
MDKASSVTKILKYFPKKILVIFGNLANIILGNLILEVHSSKVSNLSYDDYIIIFR